MSAWTAADAAELDVLMWKLAGSYQEHRERCEECQPEPCPVLVAYREHKAGCWNCDNGVTFETATYGPPCWIRRHFIAHGDTCKRGLPCPRLREAIGVVLDWQQTRQLLTRGEKLRIDRALQALKLAGVVAEAAASSFCPQQHEAAAR